MDLNTVNEEWVENKLSAGQVDASTLVAVLMELSVADRVSEAKLYGQKLYDVLVEREDVDQALPVLQWLAVALNAVPDVTAALKKLLSKSRNDLKLIEPAGFGNGVSLEECFKRLRHLRSLKEGMICYNPTWGVGVIERIDYFYQILEIEFKGRGDHELAFTYAAEALEILDENHILYIKYRKPDEMTRLLKEDPAEVVRKTLRSYGAMPIARLQETLCPLVVAEKDWKKFWDAARKALKNDATVEIPKKRSEPIEVFKSARAYDDTWFAAHITPECDIEMLFERFKEIFEKEINFSTDAAKAALSNRLAFIINGAPSSHPEWKAQGMIYARMFDIQPSGLDVSRLIHDLVEGDLVSVCELLQARQLQTLLSILYEIDKPGVTARLVEIIPEVSHPVLNEIFASLLANDEEKTVRDLLSEAVGKRTASAPMLFWCQRSTDWMVKWGFISKGDLAFRIQEVLEENLAGAMLRAQNQLRDRFSAEEWLHDVMDDMTEQQRRDFLRRMNEGRGWDALDRKSVIAKILRKYPELQDIILGQKGSSAPRKEQPVTSTRRYEEKQKLLEKLMKVDIPENSKEIELARSYGDLRENAEFKYAKERQGLLMAQGAQLAEDLEKVKPTDFADVALDEVAMGTGVELVYPNGQTEIFYLLGMWDQNEALSIISSETRLAKALIGHMVEDDIEIPSGTCRLKAILPLSDEVRAWVRGA